MIIEKLAKLDKQKRILASVLAVLAVACICYYAITRGFVLKLWTSKAKYAGIQTTYAGTANYDADFHDLQRRLENMEQQLEEQRQKCFSSKQAFQFFENINTLALAHNLKPISRVISKPEKLVVSEETEPQQRFLKTQSVNITVAGNYFDIVEFVNELTNRSQRVCVTDLKIVLPPGEKFNPNASFDVALLIDMSEEVEERSTYPL